jgi:hypothetical protein
MPALAQFGSVTISPRPSGRVSIYTNVSRAEYEGGFKRDYREISTYGTYSLSERDTDGLVYGLDFRHAHDAAGSRSDRLSIYEGYVGARVAGGRVMLRGGHLWLNDLGALGSVAGGTVEMRTRPAALSNVSALRVGGFIGREPNTFVRGYVKDVQKHGGYLTLEGERARRHSVGFVNVKYGSMTERAVVTASNLLPVGRKFFLYQAAEVDVAAPGGKAHRGLNYFLTNARLAPTLRWDLQGTFSRGRSIDARGIAEDSRNGSTIATTKIDGFLYESMGGRVSVEVASRIRVNAGYSRDKNNRDDRATSRVTIGGYAGNLAGSGFDLSASDSYMDRAAGPYHARYVSIGRQLVRSVYVSGDLSTSLAVLRFSRSDGVVVEMRPHTTRITGSAVINVGRTTSLLVTIDRTVDDTSRDLRLLSGITYRLR